MEEGSAPTGSLVGAFVDDELRGVQAVKQGESGGTVSLVIHTDRKQLMSFRLWNSDSSTWETIVEKYEIGSGDMLGAAIQPVLLTVRAKPRFNGLIREQQAIRFEISPGFLETHKLQRSVDLIGWEDVAVDGLQVQDELIIKPNKSQEFFRLAPR